MRYERTVRRGRTEWIMRAYIAVNTCVSRCASVGFLDSRPGQAEGQQAAQIGIATIRTRYDR